MPVAKRYKDLKAFYDGRAKRNDYRSFGAAYYRITMDGEAIVLQECDGADYTVKPRVRKFRELARITPDDLFTVTAHINGRDIGAKSTIIKVIGTLFEIRGKESRKVNADVVLYHKLPGQEFKPVGGFGKGTVIDLANNKPHTVTPLVVTKTDRKASKPLYEHVRRCAAVMDLLFRLGDLNPLHDYQTRKNYRKLTDAFAECPTGITEEEIALQAETAYELAESRTGGVPNYTYIRDPATGYQQSIQIHIEERRARAHDMVKNLATKYLREKLKAAHAGCLYVEPLNKQHANV